MDVKVLVIEDDQDIVDAVALAFKIYWPEAKVLSSNAGTKGIEMTKRNGLT